MSNLPSVKRFYSEDFQGSPDWFKRFLSQLNLFSDPVVGILNQQVNVIDNTNEEIYTLQVTNASATGTSNTFTFVPQKFIGAPHGILLGQCLLNSSTGIAGAVNASISWVWTGSAVSILAVYGLSAGLSYTLSLRIY